jgi:prevent-host-death family protein
MYIWMYMRRTITKSLAATRKDLPSLLDETEKGSDIVVTRRGKAVGVIIPYQAYLRTTGESFAEVLKRLAAHPPKHLDGTEFDDLRDQSAGR